MNIIICLLAVVGVVGVYSLPWDQSGSQTRATCECGWTNKGRIVGGSEARKNAYPLMVALEYNLGTVGDQFCGGSIITQRHVLTAAHCTEGEEPDGIQVRVGAHSIKPGDGSVYAVSRIINHEGYRHKLIINDIALVVTRNKMNFNQNIGPVCLPSSRLSLTGQKIKALGWGDTVDGGKGSSILREVDLQVITYKQCETSWKTEKLHPTEATNMCTYTIRKDTCQGDSGGPLIWMNPATRRFTQAALVSYGGACGGKNAAVNTDVSAFLPWINRNIHASVPGLSACIKG